MFGLEAADPLHFLDLPLQPAEVARVVGESRRGDSYLDLPDDRGDFETPGDLVAVLLEESGAGPRPDRLLFKPRQFDGEIFLDLSLTGQDVSQTPDLLGKGRRGPDPGLPVFDTDKALSAGPFSAAGRLERQAGLSDGVQQVGPPGKRVGAPERQEFDPAGLSHSSIAT